MNNFNKKFYEIEIEISQQNIYNTKTSYGLIDFMKWSTFIPGRFTWRGVGVVTSTFEIKGQIQEDLTKAICFDAFHYYFIFISS